MIDVRGAGPDAGQIQCERQKGWLENNNSMTFVYVLEERRNSNLTPTRLKKKNSKRIYISKSVEAKSNKEYSISSTEDIKRQQRKGDQRELRWQK